SWPPGRPLSLDGVQEPVDVLAARAHVRGAGVGALRPDEAREKRVVDLAHAPRIGTKTRRLYKLVAAKRESRLETTTRFVSLALPVAARRRRLVARAGVAAAADLELVALEGILVLTSAFHDHPTAHN